MRAAGAERSEGIRRPVEGLSPSRTLVAKPDSRAREATVDFAHSPRAHWGKDLVRTELASRRKCHDGSRRDQVSRSLRQIMIDVPSLVRRERTEVRPRSGFY